MPRILTHGAAALVLLGSIAACSSSSSTSSASSAASASSASSSDAAVVVPASGGADSVPATAESAPTSATTPDSTAPAGDGKWHPVISTTSAADSVVPPPVLSLIDGQPIESVSASSASLYDIRSYQVLFDTTCDVELAALVANATAGGLHIEATGTNGTASWLVADDGAYDGANLSLEPGSTDGTCAMAGLPLTPVRLTLTGVVNDTVTRFVGVGCGAIGDGIEVGIWGAPLDSAPTTAAMIWITTVDGTAPGQHEVRDVDQTLFTTGDTWTLAQELVIATAERAAGGGTSDDSDGGSAVEGLNTLSGTVTMAGGLASGSLDLSTSGEHITGTFSCGTPAFTPLTDAPPDTGVPPASDVPPTS